MSVWDSRTLQEVVRIPHDPQSRAVVAMAFSPDGGALVTVTSDNSHTVTIWDWRAPRAGHAKKGQQRPRGWLGEGPGFADAPVAVRGVAWDPYPRGLARHKAAPEGTEAARAVAAAAAAPGGGSVFATFGKHHLKLWDTGRDGRWAVRRAAARGAALPSARRSRETRLIAAAPACPPPTSPQATTWTFGKLKQADVLSATFLPPPADGAVTLATGMAGGDVCLWRAGAAVARVAAHTGKPRPGGGCAKPLPCALGGAARRAMLRLFLPAPAAGCAASASSRAGAPSRPAAATAPCAYGKSTAKAPRSRATSGRSAYPLSPGCARRPAPTTASAPLPLIPPANQASTRQPPSARTPPRSPPSQKAPMPQLTAMDVLGDGSALLVATDAGNAWEVALDALTGAPAAQPLPRKLLDVRAAPAAPPPSPRAAPPLASCPLLVPTLASLGAPRPRLRLRRGLPPARWRTRRRGTRPSLTSGPPPATTGSS